MKCSAIAELDGQHDARARRRRCQHAVPAAGPTRGPRRPRRVAPQVPSVVLAEALTRDHPRDFPANRLLRTCQIRDVDELMARSAARLRTATGQPSRISAVDAVVAALADATPDSVVLTSDPGDLTARSGVSGRGFAVRAI